MGKRQIITAALGLLFLGSAPWAWADLSPQPVTGPVGWKNEAKLELAYAAVFGNAESQTGRFKSEYQATIKKNEFIFQAGGSYGRSQGVENTNTYFGNGKWSYYFIPTTYTFGLLGFESNKYAGFWARDSARIGFGHIFFQTRTHKLSGEQGVDYSYEIDVNLDARKKSFSGTTSSSYKINLNSRAQFGQDFTWIYRWEYVYDYRLDSETALSVKITGRLGLKSGVSIVYANIPLKITTGSETGNLKKTDTVVFTAFTVII